MPTCLHDGKSRSGQPIRRPLFLGINTLAINKKLVQKALGTEQLPENEWDLVFNPEYTKKLKSCGISYFDSAIEQIPLALHYLGKDPNTENPDDIKAAVNMMKKSASRHQTLHFVRLY